MNEPTIPLRWPGPAFVAILAVVGLMQIVGWDYNASGDTTVRAWPDVDSGSWLDPDFYAAVDGGVADRLALRGPAQRIMAAVDLELFGDTLGGDSVAGSGGFLFYEPSLNPSCENLRQLRELIIGDTLTAIPVMVTVPKAAIHGNALPNYAMEDPCVSAERALLDAAIGPLGIIDELQALVAEGGDAFFRVDTHWSGAARSIAARAVIGSFDPGIWDPNAVEIVTEPGLSDLERFAGIHTEPALHELPRVNLPFEVHRSESAPVLGQDLLIRFHSTSNGPHSRVPGVTYLLGDSQIAQIIPLLAPYFEELHYTSWLAVELGAPIFPDESERGRIFVQTVESSGLERLSMPVFSDFIDRLGDAAG